MLSAVNLSLAERRIEAQFVSIIYAVWDDEHRTLTVANSGLPRPIYVHDGKNEVIEATGLPLGLFDEADYDEFKFRMKPGDMFVFFSDGILDARNRKGELFGRGRVENNRRRVRRISRRTASSIRSSKPWPSTPPAWKPSTIRPWSPSECKAARTLHARENDLAQSEPSVARPPGFVYREMQTRQLTRRTLFCTAKMFLCRSWPSSHGTPLYVYSAATIRERYARVRRSAFRDIPHTICYSVKGKFQPGILRLLAQKRMRLRRGLWRRTGTRARADRKAAKQVVFSGVGKTRDELSSRLKAGILLFNVESESELWVLASARAPATRRRPSRCA